MSQLDHISPDGRKGNEQRSLPEDLLMRYLEGKLSPAGQREVEQWLADDGMESDAVEGLKALNPAETKRSVKRLNRKLRKSIPGRRQRRQRPAGYNTTLIAIAVILLLAIIAYIVVRKSI